MRLQEIWEDDSAEGVSLGSSSELGVPPSPAIGIVSNTSKSIVSDASNKCANCGKEMGNYIICPKCGTDNMIYINRKLLKQIGVKR